MGKVFPSKIDRWLAYTLVGAGILSTVACIPILFTPDPRHWLILIVPVITCVALPYWLFTTTKYTVGTDELLIRSGPFWWRVPIKDIVSITPTRNPLSSPALSLDRLEINYGKNTSIMVSPLDKEGFIEALRARGAKV
jgi:membrane protein YdbS with pleckstrin-like domain